MTEHIYGVTTERPTRREANRRDQIAREEGGACGAYVECNVTEGTAPGVNNGRYQAWFVGPNRGEPFDSNLARRVLARVYREPA